MATATKDRYIEGVGRRKTAVARVRITPSAKSSAIINDAKTVEQYFATKHLQDTALAALKTAEAPEKFSITVHVKGGGVNAQAEAIRHGLSRALEKFNPNLRAVLKKAGFLKRDPRAVERKHFGLKKARRAPQWSKR